MKTGNRFNSHSAAIFVIALLALFVVSGCGDKKSSDAQTNPGGTDAAAGAAPADPSKMTEAQSKAAEKKNFSSEPPPIQILVGNTTGYYVNKPTAIVAKSAADLRAMRAKHFSHGVKREPLAPIDFKTRQIVGLFLPKDRKGSLVTITDIHQEGGKIVVTAIKLTKGAGCKAAGPKPRPFHWVETRKMDPSDVVIKLKTQRSSPCTN